MRAGVFPLWLCDMANDDWRGKRINYMIFGAGDDGGGDDNIDYRTYLG